MHSYQVIFNQLYSRESEGEKGTLKQLQTAINRTNIPVKVKDNPIAVEDFIGLTLHAHIVAAAMEFFKMRDETSSPSTNLDIGQIRKMPKSNWWKSLSVAIQQFLDQFVLHDKVDQLSSNVQAFSRETANKKKSQKEAEEKEKKKQWESEDGVYSYVCRFLAMSLMARNFHDASHYGDGERLIRCWKFLLLHLKVDGRIKYSVEAFHLLAQVNALLPPHMAHQLMWNRTCNVSGGEGNNMHFNRVFNPYRTTRACATLLLRTADFAWFTEKTRVCFAARVSGFTAAKRTSKPFKKKRETCFYPIQGKSIHICLFSLGKAVPVL